MIPIKKTGAESLGGVDLNKTLKEVSS